MKPIIKIIASCTLMLAMAACETPQEVIQDPETTPFDVKVGDVYSSTFKVDNQVAVRYDVKAFNFGTVEQPCIIFVKDDYSVARGFEHFSDIFCPLEKDDLVVFIHYWHALQNFGSGLLTGYHDVPIKAYEDFKNFYTSNNVDPGAIVRLVLPNNTKAEYDVFSELESIVRIVNDANNEYHSNRMENTGRNAVVNYIMNSGITPTLFEELMEKTQTSPIALTQQFYEAGITPEAMKELNTKGVVKDVIKICKNLKEVVSMVVDLVKQNSVCSFEGSSINVLNGADLNPDNYANAQTSRSPDFSVGYLQSDATYHVETAHGNTHKTLPGKYVKSVYVNPTYARVVTGKLIGTVYYSGAINMGTDELPLAKVYASLQLQYGDCCCVQYYLNHNFTADAVNGYINLQ